MNPSWKAVGCRMWCDGGYRGMDRCNTCGCTGSELLHLPTGERYPNTKEGWDTMLVNHPDAATQPIKTDERRA